ncbi:unnamed protein product [Cuscuta campestris]|uniref:Uncharacterized protein n=1 Tax=Cuscuta campestris TaxID=132261 RepID=A0A484ME51_9ASTE|nr:unnamed protein product [Cuscuta campestris]
MLRTTAQHALGQLELTFEGDKNPHLRKVLFRTHRIYVRRLGPALFQEFLHMREKLRSGVRMRMSNESVTVGKPGLERVPVPGKAIDENELGLLEFQGRMDDSHTTLGLRRDNSIRVSLKCPDLGNLEHVPKQIQGTWDSPQVTLNQED